MKDMLDWSQYLAEFDAAVGWFSGLISGAYGPWGLLALVAPLLLALLSRSALHIVATLGLGVLTLALARRTNLDIDLVVYAATWLVALHAFPFRATQHRAESNSAQLARMRLEMTDFLEALDRRAHELDVARQSVSVSEPERERERERA